jgi:hypothetical protein
MTRCIAACMWAFAENGQTANSAILAYSLADQQVHPDPLAMQDIGASATLPATLEDMPTPDSPRTSGTTAFMLASGPSLRASTDSNATARSTAHRWRASWSLAIFRQAPDSALSWPECAR